MMKLTKNQRHELRQFFVAKVDDMWRERILQDSKRVLDEVWQTHYAKFENNPDMLILEKYGETKLSAERIPLSVWNPVKDNWSLRAAIPADKIIKIPYNFSEYMFHVEWPLWVEYRTERSQIEDKLFDAIDNNTPDTWYKTEFPEWATEALASVKVNRKKS